MRRLVVLGAAGVLLLLAVAWLLVVRPLLLPADEPASSQDSFPLTLTDDEGISITLKAKPRRIISLAPYVTETLFVIGAGDAVVAVGAGETFPAEATGIPTVLEADGLTPSAAAILAAEPDIVLASGFPRAPWKDQVRAKVPLFTFEATSVDDALSDMAVIGRLIGRGASAQALVDRMKKGLEGAPATAGPALMIETFPDPLQVAGTGGYLADLVARAGGKLVAPSEGQSVAITADMVASTDPRFYVLPTSSGTKEDLARRPGFASVPAVRQGRILVIDDDLLFRPGPRLILTLRALSEAISGK